MKLPEKKGKEVTFEKVGPQEECYRIFLDFYDNIFIPKMEEYKPVQF